MGHCLCNIDVFRCLFRSLFFRLYSESRDQRILIILLIFVGIIFLGGFLIKVIRSLVHWSGMSGLDRLLGVLFGLLRGILLIVVIYLVIPNQFKQSSFILESKSYHYLEKYAPKAEKFLKV